MVKGVSNLSGEDSVKHFIQQTAFLHKQARLLNIRVAKLVEEEKTGERRKIQKVLYCSEQARACMCACVASRQARLGQRVVHQRVGANGVEQRSEDGRRDETWQHEPLLKPLEDTPKRSLVGVQQRCRRDEHQHRRPAHRRQSACMQKLRACMHRVQCGLTMYS
eukprot:2955426-Pleurochrysis_carterae.AAC.1